MSLTGWVWKPYPSVWAWLSALSLWRDEATVAILDLDARVTALEQAGGGGGGSGTIISITPSSTTISTASGTALLVLLDASSGNIQVQLNNGTVNGQLLRFVVTEKPTANTIRVNFASTGIDAVGNPLPSIAFLNKGQGATFVWVGPKSAWYMTHGGFSM